MIFCAKKCAISGLCTSAHLHRQVEDADVSAIKYTVPQLLFPRACFRLRSGKLRRTSRSLSVMTGEVTHSERTAR